MARVNSTPDQPQPSVHLTLTEEAVRRAASGTPATPQVQDEKATGQHAAADSTLTTGEWATYYSIAAGIAVACFLVAYEFLLPNCSIGARQCAPTDLFRVGSDISMFAGLFVLALAVERLLEPWSRWIGPNTDAAKAARDEADVAVRTNPDDNDAAKKLAEAQAAVNKSRQKSSMLMWGVAVGVSFLLAAKLHVLLIAAITASGGTAPSPWVDLLATGLVIGAGTKPLHDLVSRLEKKKEVAEDPDTVT